MISTKLNNQTSLLKLMLMVILLEYLIFLFSGVSFYGLRNASYFNVFTDPIYWFFFLTGLPQFITNHAIAGLVTDIIIIVILVIAILKKDNTHYIRAAFLLLTLYYVTLTALLGHRNYQTGFVLMLFPFLFSEEKNRGLALEGVRYFFLYFYFSSGMFKINNHGAEYQDQLPNIIQTQSLPYFLESNTGWRTSLQHYLFVHQETSHALYLTALILEISFIIGFFTRKADRILGIFLVCFHLFNWMVMDISPIGQLSVIVFFLRNRT